VDLIRIRSQVIDTMNEWMIQGGGSQDVLDDASLHNAIRLFMDDNSQHAKPTSPAIDNFTVQQAWSTYEQSKKSFAASYLSQIMRPINRDAFAFKPPVSSLKTQNLSKDPPDIDHIDPEQLVESLDAMAAAAFSNVSEEVRLTLYLITSPRLMPCRIRIFL
jgi:GTPase-activating protein BEM2